MKRIEKVQVLIVGAGQAGLSLSYHLKKKKIQHIILDKGEIGSSWKKQRWDSFRLTTQNWQNNLPGFQYRGDQPEEYFSKTDVINYLESYQNKYQLPIRTHTKVQKISRIESDYFKIETENSSYLARSVVVATGSFSTPYIPETSSFLPKKLLQLHSSRYQNAKSLPPGPILLIGGGQSGFEIASDLAMSERKVYLSIDRTFFLPRNYRGKDIMHWLSETGVTDIPLQSFPAKAQMRLAPSPVILRFPSMSTCRTPSISEWQKANRVQLLGRYLHANTKRIYFAPNLKVTLNEAAMYYLQTTKVIDKHIKKTDFSSRTSMKKKAKETLAFFTKSTPDTPTLDISTSSLASVIWSTGYRNNYDWIEIPVFNEEGQPQCERGTTAIPGFYFLGLHWLHNLKSGSLHGVGEDAAHVTAKIISFLASKRVQT